MASAIIVVVIFVLLALAILFICQNGGWQGGCGGNCASCRQHCICPPGTARKCTQRRQVPGSTAYVPAVAGLIIAGEVINDLTGKQPEMVQN